MIDSKGGAFGFDCCLAAPKFRVLQRPAKPPPEVPVRVFLKSQLMAALRQHARPIIIENPDLALPFTRMLRARELRLRAVGGLVAEAMSYAISRHYSADVEAHWYIGQYVLPGNVQRIILKPKAH